MPLLSLSQSGRTTTAFKQFAKKAKVMYLGRVEQQKSEYHLVRGFTASHSHKDTDHCVGTFLHHDFIVLHRQTASGKRILITEVDLHTLHPFSHLFVLPNSLDHSWFDEIVKLYPHHRHAPYAPHDAFSPRFKDSFSVYALPTHFERSLHFVADDVAKCIDSTQQRYVFEVIDRSLYIYNIIQDAPTDKLIDLQVRFACTIASALETRNK